MNSYPALRQAQEPLAEPQEPPVEGCCLIATVAFYSPEAITQIS